MSYIPKVQNWNLCAWVPVRDKMRCITYQGQNMTATISEVVPGHAPGPHIHEHEQLVIILQGTCDFYVDSVPYALGPGCIMSIPGGVEHYIVATGTEPVLNLDVFYPVREERSDTLETELPDLMAAIPLFTRQKKRGSGES